MSIEEFTHSLAEYINADTPADHAQAIRDFTAACRCYDEDPRERQRICGIADLIKAEDANYAQALAALDRSDHDAALPLLREAAKEGIGEAAWLLAGLLEQEGDTAGAITWYQRAADDGDSRAFVKLADMRSQSATADNAIEAWLGSDNLAGTASGHMKHIDRPASSTERALTLDKERKENHHGGGRPGPLRLLIPAAILTGAATAYVAMGAPIGSQPLAMGLAMLAAFMGADTACILANRRFNRLPVLAAARISKGRMTLAAIVTVATVAMVATGFLITRPAGGAPPSHMQPSATSSAAASHRVPGLRVSASLPVAVVRGTIRVGNGPQGAVVSPDGRRVYIANTHSNAVSVIDNAMNRVIATISLPAPPQYVAIAPNGQRAYVTTYNDADGTGSAVQVIDTATNTGVSTIFPSGSNPYAIVVPPNPHWVAFTPDGRRAYVANHESNLVSVVDTASNTVVAKIPVGRSPHSVAITPDGREAFVADYDAKSVSVIDTRSDTVTATMAVGTNPQCVAVAPDGRHAYVTNNGSNTVSVIDTANNHVTATVPVGHSPWVVVVAPDGRHAYVTNNGSNTVSVLQTASGG